MSFDAEIYPVRRNRNEFVYRLLGKVDSEFTRIEWPDSIPSQVGHTSYTHRRFLQARCRVRQNHGPWWKVLVGQGETRSICLKHCSAEVARAR